MENAMRRLVCLFAMFMAAAMPAPASASMGAQTQGTAQTGSTPSPVSPAPGAAAVKPDAPPPPAAQLQRQGTLPANCESELPGARIGAPSGYVVQLDPDTLWRPRGTEVRFTIASTAGPLPNIVSVQACFRWEYVKQAERQAALYADSPLVRSVPNSGNAIEYGAMIPNFSKPASLFGEGAQGTGAVEYTAVYTVPVADMQVLVQLDDGKWFAVILPVGITNVPTALGVLTVALLLSAIVLWRWGGNVMLRQDEALGQARNPMPSRSLPGRVNRHLLAIVSTSNGVASLSQFQIMLWAFVVAGAAVYVMVLSGNLIAISNGTLILLGIAGGTSVLARVPGASDADRGAPTMQVARWSQMLIDDPARPEIDVTRVQMLIFTLISAAFVGMKVATSYSIPEIPPNFLLLMGISNGVYLAGRQVASKPKGSA
jgi:hypothetical protein